MKYLLLLTFTFSGCGVTIHSDPVKVDPIQVQVSTTINYSLAQEYCSNQCAGNQACTTSCYDQFLAVLAAASSEPIATPTPSPTP